MEVGDFNKYEIEFLTNEEKSSISLEIFEKIKLEWSKKQEELSDFQKEIEKGQTNSDQHKFQVEKELIDLRKALEEEGQQKTEAQNHLSLLKEEITNKNENLENSNSKINTLQQQLQQNRLEKEAISEQCSSVTANLESKSKLNNELKEQLKILEEQLSVSQRSKCDALIKAEEASGAQLQMQYKERRYEEENARVSHELELLQKQLEKRSEEFLALRSDNSSSILNLQVDFNHATEEARLLREENEALLKENVSKKERIQELLKSLNETRESESQLDSAYKRELASQEKLTNLFKAQSESKQKHCEELEKGVQELRQLLQEASEQYGALEKAKSHSEKEAEQALDEKDLLIKDLQEELQKVNELLKCSTRRDEDALSEISPAASAASQLMRKGLTLSQLYTEYLNTTEKLFRAEDENKRMTRYVEQILNEIEEKAPFLRKQREDYEKALETINILHTQIDNSIEDLEKQRLEAAEAQRRSNYLGRENAHLNQQVKDLSKQVAVLLTHVEAARAGLSPPPLPSADHIHENGSASDVIDQHLVTFRDVSEMQEQNKKLLASLRDLTDKLESAEKTAVEAKTQELTEELDLARKELLDLKAARERMQTTVENITRQRDMYRTVLNEQNSTATHPKQKLDKLSTDDYEKLQAEMEKSRKEVDKLRKDHEDYRKERTRNEQMERNEMEKLKSFSEKTKNDNIRLLSQAEYNEERLKTLQSNCEAYQRQVNALEDKSDTLQGIIGRHEGTIESLRENTLAITKKLAHLEVMSANLKEEKSLLKESEARLLAERDSLQRSQYSQSLLLNNLEAIKNSLDKHDSETRMRFENQISSLTEQNCHLKAKIESNMDLKEAQSKLTSLEEQLRVSKEEIDAKKKVLSETEQKVIELTSQLNETQQEKARFGGQSPSLNRYRSSGSLQVSPSTPKSSSAITHTVKELQIQLTEERAKSASLQISFEQAQTNLNNLKNVVDQQESQIKESSESYKTAQNEINSLRKAVDEAKLKLGELEEKLIKAADSEKALKETMDERLMRMTEDLEERENELEETQKKLENAKEAEEKARAQMIEQSRISVEVQDKYEREVMLHGADLQALSALKTKLSDHNGQLETASAARLRAEESLNEIKAIQEDKMKMTEKVNSEMKLRVDELESQNKTLLDQFTKLSEQMSTIHTKLSSGVEGANSSFSEDEARSSEQLLEIIKYLRKEREVAAGKVEVMQAESLRLEAQKKCLEDQVNLLNKHLVEEREKNQTSVESAGKYAEMMRKVHTLDALADSNRLLREEKNFLKTSLEESKAKVTSYESQIEPLQEELREAKTKLENLTAEKISLESEKENYKKRSQELVEKLNKSRPEDVIKLQQEVNNLEKNSQAKEKEINRFKTMLNHLQNNHKGVIANKNQLQVKLQHAEEEAKKYIEEGKKLSQEKVKLQQQSGGLMEKIKAMENENRRLQDLATQEQVKQKEIKSQLLQQILDLRHKEETVRKELEIQKKEFEASDIAVKEMEEKLVVSSSKMELLQKQNIQLRKIANKYKTKVETKPESSEAGTAAGDEENEEKKILKSDPSMKTEEPNKMQEQISLLQSEIQKKTEELSKIKSQDGGFVAKLQSDLEIKSQELQKANVVHLQFREKSTTDLVELKKKLEESQSKKSVYESRIHILEKEKENVNQQFETLNKKLSIQQKMIENLQKQTSTVQKLSPNVISIEKASDPPPTANIKPMAAPIPTPAVSSPRSQGSSQSGSCRSIPTASIRPMAPTSTPVSQTSSSVVVVPPMETHSGGDGAVSSTVTLPQATVTPTPVAPASTTTQAFPSTLTATVSPTPVSQSSIASTAPFVQPHHSSMVPRIEEPMEAAVTPTTSGSADALISQAIALVTPQVEDRGMGGQKRKLESVLEREEEEEEELEDAKRTRMLEEEARAMEEENEEDEEMQQEEDMGEPSSSSHPGERKEDDEEILVVSSDEEGEVPSSQSDRVEEDQEESANEGGREAEAEGSEENEVPLAPSSSLQPPPRPLHEPPTSSSRQSLALFHHQLPNYEEGVDDRIVPSTPTLFVSRPCEGAAGDGVSSPQVPSQGFEFGSTSGEGGSDVAAPSSDGLSQIAEGGIIDVTRMDLAQLDDGSHQVVASARDDQGYPSDANAEGNISSSADDGEQPEEVTQGQSSHLVVPSSEANEGEDRMSGSDYVVSSQDVVESDVEGRQVSEEEEVESLSQEEEEEEEEEDMEERSDDRLEVMAPARETRSSSGSQGRVHAPITWRSESPTRGLRGARGIQGRFQRHRGTSRARRSRSGFK